MNESVGTSPDDDWSWTLLQTKYKPLREDFFHSTHDCCLHTAHTIPSIQTQWSALLAHPELAGLQQQPAEPPAPLLELAGRARHLRTHGGRNMISSHAPLILPYLAVISRQSQPAAVWFCFPGPCGPTLSTNTSACCTQQCWQARAVPRFPFHLSSPTPLG